MRRCPRCTFALLPPRRAASPGAGAAPAAAAVEACPRCHGIFVQAAEAPALLGENAAVAVWARSSAARALGKSALLCPAGHGRLNAYRVLAPPGAGLAVEVDVCPACLGMWLDAWEAARLRQATRQLAREPGYIPSHAPPGEEKDGPGWYLFQLLSGMPVEEYNPVRRRPVVVLAILLLCVAGFALGLAAPDRGAFLRAWGAVPAELAAGRGLFTIATHLFLHGSALHLLANLYFLYIFGDNVEDRVGRLRFLGLYLAFGIAALVTQMASVGPTTLPLIGASGAIAGLMGAYLMLFPRTRVFVVVLFIRLRLPIAVYFGAWIALQAGLGLLSIVEGQVGGVAWWAHLGGFLAGALWGLAARGRYGDGAEARAASART
jgi:membrane associated rhomboid family serine protease/Zn-finger nucleic acid-binding protein